MFEKQSIVFAKFIISYQEVFAKNDFDMGSFNGEIQHRIDTGNAKPIRQKLRRTPLCFKKRRKRTFRSNARKGYHSTILIRLGFISSTCQEKRW